jgi:hypothetical protein
LGCTKGGTGGEQISPANPATHHPVPHDPSGPPSSGATDPIVVEVVLVPERLVEVVLEPVCDVDSFELAGKLDEPEAGGATLSGTSKAVRLPHPTATRPESPAAIADARVPRAWLKA